MQRDVIHNYEPLWGSWYVDSFIGEGSFGRVYKVRKQEFDRTYYSAVKIITIPQSESDLRQMHGEGMDEASVRSYFYAFVLDIIQEVDLMSEFRGNSHIVSFEDHKVIERTDSIGWHILIRMELLTSLTDRIGERPLTEKDIVKLGIDICHALELCAQKKMIHRDIKPDNIFVSPYGDYKLGDFGIARQVERTMTAMSKKGTFTYMAPEVFHGKSYNATVDIYSLGIVLYRLLNRNRAPFLPPFPEQITPTDREESQMKRLRGDPLPPLVEASTDLSEIVLKACAHDSGKRYQTATEMRLALEAYAESGESSKTAYVFHVPPEKSSPDHIDDHDAEAQDIHNLEIPTPPPTEGAARDDGNIEQGVWPDSEEYQSEDESKPGKAKKTRRLVAILIAILGIVIAILVFVLANLQVRKIELGEGCTLQQGEEVAQAFSISPKRPIINDLVWTSSNGNVLTVTEDGQVTAVGPGEAVISLASARGKVEDSAVYRVELPAKGIEGVPETIRLAAGTAQQLSPQVYPAGTTDALQYESMGTNLVKVDAGGLLEALEAGETTIRIMCGDVVYEVPVVVYIAAERIDSLPALIRLSVDKTQQLKPTVQPSDCVEPISYKSGDETIAKVSENGEIQAVKSGKTSITVRCGDVEERVDVDVYISAESIELLPEKVRIPIMETTELQPVVLPSDSVEEVTYKSQDESIAIVDHSGQIKGLKAGNTIVVVRCDEIEAMVEVEVFIPAKEISGLPSGIRVERGKTEQLLPIVSPVDTTDTLLFGIKDEKIASVDAEGKITGINSGFTTITVTCGALVKTVDVEIFVPISAIEGVPETIRLVAGKAQQLSPQVYPIGTTDTLQYESMDTNIVKLDDKGLLEALEAGETLIRITGGNVVREVSVSIYIAAEKIGGLPASLRLSEGKTQRVKPVIQPADCVEPVSYESGDETIVKVSVNGEVQAVKSGKTSITIRCGDVEETVDVDVYVAAKSIELLPEKIRVPIMETTTLQPVVLPSESIEEVNYKSQDESIAIVDRSGQIKGLKVGKTTIIVRCDEIEERVEVEIYVPAIAIEGVPEKLRIVKGTTEKLTPAVKPDNTTEAIRYSSENEKVALVDVEGEITGADIGLTRIKINCGDVEKIIEIEVLIPAEAIEGLPSTIRVEKGKEERLLPILRPADASEPIQYSSKNETVALVDIDGKVTGVNSGITSITVTCGKIVKTISVEIFVPVSAIEDLPEGLRMKKGAEIQLKPTILPTNTTEAIEYKSENTNVVLVNSEGVLKGINAGETTVIVSSGDISCTISVDVYVAAEAVIGLPSSSKLAVGKKLQLNPTVQPSDSKENLAYSSGNENIVKISAKGELQAVAPGKAQIVVRCGDVIAAVDVEIYIPAKSFERLPDKVRIPIMGTETLQPVVLPSESVEVVTYKSKDENIALVDRNGNVNGLNKGNTTIIVRCDEIEAAVEVEVYVPIQAINGLPEALQLDQGQRSLLKYTLLPADTTEKPIFQSSNNNIVNVSSAGEVEAVAPGDAEIRITSGDVSYSVHVQVLLPAESIEGLPKTIPLNKGQSERLMPKVVPASTTDSLSYESTNERVAKIDGAGNLTAIGAGQTSVKVVCGKISRDVEVIVSVPAETLSIKADSYTMIKGEVLTLNPSVYPSDTTDAVSYKSDNTSIASIDAKGQIKAVVAGKTTITMSAGKLSQKVQIEVIVPAKSITSLPKSLRLERDEKYSLKPNVTPADTTDKLQFFSDNPSIVSVDDKGNLVAHSAGNTSIVVSCGDKNERIPIVVYVPVKSITLEMKSITLEMGQQYQIRAAVAPSDATTKDVKFSTTGNLLSVSNSGLIYVTEYKHWYDYDVGRQNVRIMSSDIVETIQVHVVNSYRADWSASKRTVNGWNTDTLNFAKTVPSCTGFDVKFTVIKGYASNRKWGVYVYDSSGWKRVGEVITTDLDVEANATITFDAKNISSVILTPSSQPGSGKSSNSFNLDITNLRYSLVPVTIALPTWQMTEEPDNIDATVHKMQDGTIYQEVKTQSDVYWEVLNGGWIGSEE